MKLKTSSFSWVLGLVCILLMFNLINACDSLKQKQNPDQVFFSKFKITGEQTSIKSYNDLNGQVEKLLHDGTHIFTTDLRRSDDGSFFYLYSKGHNGDLHSTIATPLDFDPNGPVLSLNDEGCLHRCDQAALNPCTTCELTIHEKCKRQSSTCKSGDGGCGGSIVFQSESPK